MRIKKLGIAEGKKLGVIEGKEQLILSMLKNQLFEDLIEKITDFPKEKINELKNAIKINCIDASAII